LAGEDEALDVGAEGVDFGGEVGRGRWRTAAVAGPRIDDGGTGVAAVFAGVLVAEGGAPTGVGVAAEVGEG
jgi:hypothetical protein